MLGRATQQLHEGVVRILDVVQQLPNLLFSELIARSHFVKALYPLPHARFALKVSWKLRNFV